MDQFNLRKLEFFARNVDFGHNDLGELQIVRLKCDVHGDVHGNIRGSVTGDVHYVNGDVVDVNGNVNGEIGGCVKGAVRGGVHGSVGIAEADEIEEQPAHWGMPT